MSQRRSMPVVESILKKYEEFSTRRSHTHGISEMERMKL